MKWLVVCAPDGTIMFVHGPYAGSQFDDTIFRSIINDANDPLAKWLRTLPPGSLLGFDAAGFPQAAEHLAAAGMAHIHVTLPDRVTRTDGTFTADAADSNRLLTRWRGVIERVNRQLKICKLLSKSYPNSELCTSPVYWRASAIMCNKYRHASLTRFDQPARFVLLSSLMLYIDYHIDAEL